MISAESSWRGHRLGSAAVLCACGPTVAAEDDDASAEARPEETLADPSEESSTSVTATFTSTTPHDDGGDLSGFIDDVDMGWEHVECDIWADDCPAGEKCMPWSDNTGSEWNATRCSPIARDPKSVGEPCTVVDGAMSGVDDCEPRAMCWDVDPTTSTGECVAFCHGSEANPICTDPCDGCSISSDSTLVVCLPYCDPLAQDCNEVEACYLVGTSFVCVPDVSRDAGALGDPCEFLNTCDPGLLCGAREWIPDCPAIGCCTPFCDPSAPAPCPESVPGTQCVPLLDEGANPPCGSVDVGACMFAEGG